MYLESILREATPKVRARLVGEFRDFDLAEDALQEALLKAWQNWPEQGVPDYPAAWLTTVAKRQAIDVLRKRNVHTRALEHLSSESDEQEIDLFQDDLLRLIFTCCHPALSQEAQVALTLRTVVDLSLEQIAQGFLVAPRTMEQRLVRSKRKIKQTAIPYEIPGTREFPERLNGVLKVIYLIFNEGYSATVGPELLTTSFCKIGIQLGRQLARLIRGNSEILGLLSLMLLQHSRASARVDAQGELVLLDDQDRALWDRLLIREGTLLLDKALALRQRPGPYQVQAAIAASHALAATATETDWNEILSLYDKLLELQPSSVVKLNRAVAVAMARGVHRGLQELQNLSTDSHLLGFYLFHSTRGALYMRAKMYEESMKSYQVSLGLAKNEREQAFIRRQIDTIQNRIKLR